MNADMDPDTDSDMDPDVKEPRPGRGDQAGAVAV